MSRHPVAGFVLDTNLVFELHGLRGAPAPTAWLAAQDPARLFLTATVLGELALGIARLPAGRRRSGFAAWLGEVRRLFQGRILPFDEAAALVYGEVVAAARARGRPPQIGDAQIAAVARRHGLAVATRDAGGFAHLGADIVDPWGG